MKLEILSLVLFVGILIPFFVMTEMRWRRTRKRMESRLKKEFFPQLIQNLKVVDERLSEEANGEGYVELLGRDWKSTLILDFHQTYGREEEIFTKLKQDLEDYEEEIREWKKTGDERSKEKLIKRKRHIREKLMSLNEKLEMIR